MLTKRAIRPYKMTELPFSLTEKMNEVNQWTKMSTDVTFLYPHVKNETFGLNWQNGPNHRDKKWRLTLNINYQSIIILYLKLRTYPSSSCTI
ncbi:hypothetical protein Hdeb2414_s0010g00354821 [Helianthus debilis subsp. tardiflorus]